MKTISDPHNVMFLALKVDDPRFGMIMEAVEVKLPERPLNKAERVYFRTLLEKPHPMVKVLYSREDLTVDN